MGNARRAGSGSLLCAMGAALLAWTTVTAPAGAAVPPPPTHGRVQETPSEQPSEQPSEEPSAEPTESTRPSRTATPRPTCGTVVCPTLTAAPSPSRTRPPSPVPTFSDEPEPTPTPRSRTPDPLATPEDPQSTRPDPVLPSVEVTELPVSQPSFDDTSTEEPSPLADAGAGASGGRSPGELFATALAAVVLLGGAGAAGLYLTREPRGAP